MRAAVVRPRSALSGKRVLLTRAQGQAEGDAALLRDAGAVPVVVPAIAIGPPDDASPAARALAAIGRYGWVAFTSANGVERAWELAGRDVRVFLGAKLAAVGPATADALRTRGLTVDVVATDTRGEGLAAELLARAKAPGHLLLLRAQEAREALPDRLRGAGWTVDVAAVYATRAPEELRAQLAPLFSAGRLRLDAAIFSSGSTVRHVCAALAPGAATKLAGLAVATIGPVTTEAARALGVRVDAEASPSTLPAAIAALAAHLGDH